MQKIVVVCRPRNRDSQLKTRKTLPSMTARLPHRVADGL